MNRECLKNSKSINTVYVIALTLILVSALVPEIAIFYRSRGNSIFDWIFKAMKLLGYILCLWKIFLCRDEYKMNQKILSIVLITAFVISSFRMHYTFFFLIAILFIATIGVDSKIVAATSVLVQGSILMITVLLSQIGGVEDFIVVEWKRVRHALGFSWTTVAPILFFFISLFYIYYRAEKFKWYEAVALEMINYYMYRMTETRMTFWLSSFVVVFFGIQSIWKKMFYYLGKIKYIYMILPVIFMLVLIVLSLIYNPKIGWQLKINELLSGRLELGASAIKEYGFSIFGQPIEWLGSDINEVYPEVGYNYVDCSYLQLALRQGILIMLIVVGIYMMGIYKSIKADNYWGVFVLLFVLIHCITEPHIINIVENAVILLPFTKMEVHPIRKKFGGFDGSDIKITGRN